MPSGCAGGGVINHPIKIAFVVDDIGEAVNFYSKILDLRIVARFPSSAGPGEDFVFLKSESIFVELLPRKAMGGAPEGFHHLAFLVDSVDKRLEQLRQRGAVVKGEAYDPGPGGIRLGNFAGPGGILLRLFTNGRLREKTPSERISIHEIVEPGTTPARVATGFDHTGGPVWHGADNCFYFNDVPAAATYRYAIAAQVEEVRTANGNASGACIDLDGGMLTCQLAHRRVAKIQRDGSETVVTDRVGDERYHGPNDVIVRSDGSIFFTDSPGALVDGDGELDAPARTHAGVFHVRPGHSPARCASRSFVRPAGLCLSPDESLLYVSDAERHHILAFDVDADGALTGERVFAEVRGDAPGGPAGMKVDALGNLWVAGPGGLWIYDPRGTKIGVVAIPEPAGNFCFGDTDGRTLIIAAGASVYRMRVGVSGA
jgi:gluconolactonase